ncbi:hypothetical protein EV122DRAFT_200428 [Schizophyllum commune]
MWIETDSKWTLGEILSLRHKHDDLGYIDNPNGPLIRATINALRKRKAHTYFRWIKGHAGHHANEIADMLAGEGARKEEIPFELDDGSEWNVTGIKLRALTQSHAYKTIMIQKLMKMEKRPRTQRNMLQILDDLEEEFWVQFTEATVWKAIRSKHIQRETRYFLWMVAHDAYSLGERWLRESYTPDIQERAYCKQCGALETMNHILLECDSAERQTVWKRAEEMWLLTGEQWHEPSIGVIVGAACAVFRTEKGRPKTGLGRLWTIIESESAHLIWKMRCERVIQNGGANFSSQEVENRWNSTMTQRLEMDRRLTYSRYGKKALSASVVDSTWKSVIREYENLPPNWVGDGGVLVGIRFGEG